MALLSSASVLAVAPATRAQPADPLAAEFRSPPASARPRVWWHWMNGNISVEGIDNDLAWMKRVGIAGVQNFDASFGSAAGPFSTPQVVDKRLVFLTPEWRSAFRHAVEKADALGMEFAIAGSPGWSESGGPWVTPQQAMKKLVWSETRVRGGHPLSSPLAAPPSTTGPFQDIRGGGSATTDAENLPTLYRDAAVIAYRAPPAEAAPAPAAKVTASSPIDTAALRDGVLSRQVNLPFSPGAESWIQFDYGRPQTVRALRLVAAKTGGFGEFGATAPEGRIEASQDGVTFKTLAALPTKGAPEQTLAFPATTARYFRVVFAPRHAGVGLIPTPAPTSHPIAELAFETAARVHRFEDKAGWAATGELDQQPTPAVAPAAILRRAEVVDLTGRLRPDGTLDWTPPAGTWVVLRFGYSLTGRQNSPASPEGTGLEVDKLSRAHVTAYADTYLGEYEKTVGHDLIGKRGLQAMITDSWEAGAQNWTEDMVGEFQRRRGYDPRPWMPVLAGRVVDSAEASDRFLWDFRKTVGDLIADAHYGALTDALHARGMRRYGESHEAGRAFVGDGMQVKKSADVPMGATWTETPANNDPFTYDADIRESASVAHLYGQNLVAAESFTAATNTFGYTPRTLKPVADRMLANGLNRFVIHTSVHQPVETTGPGMTLAVFGQWFTRKETWAEQAGPWVDYLARSSLLLQQGRFVADIAWFYGEDDNITERYGKALPKVPAGYAYDFVNADALVTQLSVKDGRLVTPSGMSYRVLAIDPGVRRMTVPVLKKLRDLQAAGATIIGAPPLVSPSQADDPAVFRQLVAAVFGKTPGADLAQGLAAIGLASDVDDGGAGLRYVHRALPHGDFYFISNPTAQAKALDVSFRTAGRPAEIWRAEAGVITPSSYRTVGARTVVPLKLEANDAVFVVFHGRGGSQRTVAETEVQPIATLGGGWDVAFPPGRGAPAEIRLDALSDLSRSGDPGVRYFSGVATYTKTVEVSAADLQKGRVLLDLGDVAEVAELAVNGVCVGVAWKPPYRLDITEALKPGTNTLAIKVANTWPNRLIGDRQPGATPIAQTSFNPFPPNAPLPRSGLLGPVTLLRASR
jgi:hypothetical protein